MDFGEWLREQLNQRGLTMQAFADQVGVSQPAVSNWVAGKRRPDANSAAKIAYALQLPLEDVFIRLARRDPNAELVRRQLQTLRALEDELNELVEQKEETLRRIDDVDAAIIRNREHLALFEKLARNDDLPYGLDPEAIGKFLAKWFANPFSRSNMPHDLQVAYLAGFMQGEAHAQSGDTHLDISWLDPPQEPRKIINNHERSQGTRGR